MSGEAGRILMVAPWTSLDGAGGDTTHLRAVWERLARAREVHLVARARRAPPGVSTVVAPRMRLVESGASLLHARLKLSRLGRAFRPQAVYERNHAFGVGVRAAEAIGVPSVVEVNGLLTRELRMLGVREALVRRLAVREADTLTRAGGIIAVSQAVADALLDLHPVEPSKVHVLENGVDLVRFRPGAPQRSTFGIPEDRLAVAFVGTLSPWAGVDRLLEGIRRLPTSAARRICLVVAGDGSELARMKALATSLGVDARFLGRVPHESVPALLASVDACAAFKGPTPGSPTKVKEYLACGRPVLASESPDLAYVEKEGLGLCVDPTVADAVADAILTFLEKPDERAAMGARARAWAQAHASWDAVAERTLAILDGLAAGGAAAGSRG